MKKFILSALALFALALAIPAFADQPAVPADGSKLDKTKQPVVFNHSTHKDVKCGLCHHPVEGKEDYRKCSTEGCHDSMDRKDKTEKGYYHIRHDKGTKFPTCLGCHIEVIAAKPELKKELTACKGSKCHP